MWKLERETVEKNLIDAHNALNPLISVYENQQFRWFTLSKNKIDNITIQGVMSLCRPEQVLVPVNQSMLLFLLKPVKQLSMLNLGLGAAGVERFIYNLQQTTGAIEEIKAFDTVEINPEVISIAKKHFNLPQLHCVITQSAEDYIKQCQRRYNVISIDIFNDEHHQPFLNSSHFWLNIKRCCKPQCQLAINLNPQTGLELQTLISTLRAHFKCLAIIEFNEYKNIVIILSQQTLLYVNVEEIKHSTLFQQIAPNLHQAINNIYHIE